jgi:hypothetical protein
LGWGKKFTTPARIAIATEALQFEIEKVQKYKITPIYKPGDVWLWPVEK